MYSVYMVTNNLNKKLYIGITKRSIKERYKQHRHKGRTLHSAIKKYGTDNFTLELVTKCTSKELAIKYEMRLIKKLRTMSPNGYNLTEGGESPECTESTRSKISKKLKGMKRTPEVAEKNRNSARISAEKRKNLPPKKRTEAAKLNISKGKTGIKLSDEHKTSISKGILTSEKYKNKVNSDHFKTNNPSKNPEIRKLMDIKRRKPVYCETLGISFLSCKHAAEYLNVDRRRISAAICYGSSVKGLKFTKITKDI